MIAIKQGSVQMHAAGHVFAIPAIADYETRREIIRGGSAKSLAAHIAFCHAASNVYLSITDAALERAAHLLAQARNTGNPTAKDEALDDDLLICAQVLEAGYASGAYIVATTNTKHLSGIRQRLLKFGIVESSSGINQQSLTNTPFSLFVDVAEWQNITR